MRPHPLSALKLPTGRREGFFYYSDRYGEGERKECFFLCYAARLVTQTVAGIMYVFCPVRYT